MSCQEEKSLLRGRKLERTIFSKLLTLYKKIKHPRRRFMRFYRLFNTFGDNLGFSTIDVLIHEFLIR